MASKDEQYPESRKYSESVDEIATVHSFIQWLESRKIVPCSRRTFTGTTTSLSTGEDVEYETAPEYRRVTKMEDLVLEFFDIDPSKYREEKDRMVEAMSSGLSDAEDTYRKHIRFNSQGGGDDEQDDEHTNPDGTGAVEDDPTHQRCTGDGSLQEVEQAQDPEAHIAGGVPLNDGQGSVRIQIHELVGINPAGRYKKHGPASGELLREKLAPILRSNQQVILGLDGVLGFGSSFLEEAFGGLIREEGFTKDEIDNKLTLEGGIKSDHMLIAQFICEEANS